MVESSVINLGRGFQGRRVVSKRYSIVLADRTTGVVRRFTISLWPTLAAVAGVFALPVLMGLGARWSARSAVEELERSNVALQIENASYREATGQLAGQISTLQAAVDSLGIQAAVDPNAGRAMEKLPALVKSRAMGGALGANSGQVLSAMFAPDLTFGVLSDLLNVMASRLDIMRSGVQRRQALAAATPSIWPVAGWLSSAYGNRRDPFTGGPDFHPGLDISADYGQPVHATADGKVAVAGPSGNYGNLVEIDHGFGIVTRYGHLSRFQTAAGQQVHRGDVIGYVGSTGRSTSAHLHYEILLNGKLTNPLKLLATP
jgi:murein DD-endopeptidase MepM/ murein hydrolase activator NlpD